MAGPFVTPEEVAGRLGVTFTAEETAQVTLLIDDVTAALTEIAGTDFGSGTATDETHVVKNRRVILNNWPVISVTTINAATYDLDSRNGIIRNPSESPVVVTYDYGFAAVPPVVKAVTAQIVGRAFGTPAHRSGHTSETTGPYTVQIGSSAAAGVAGMLPDERRLLEGLRRQIGGGIIGTIELAAWTE